MSCHIEKGIWATEADHLATYCSSTGDRMKTTEDQDRGKGAVERDDRNETTNTSLIGQLGHRDQDPLIKENDSDFPEPGNSEEHSGEKKPA